MSDPTIGPSIHPHLRAILPEDGPTLDDIKHHQRAESELLGGIVAGTKEIVDIGVDHFVKDKAIEAAAHLAKAFAAAATVDKVALVGKAFVNLQLAYEITKVAYEVSVTKPMERGKEQADGLDRDQKNLALLMIVQVAQPDVLPDGYFRSECSRVLGTSGKAAPNGSYAFQKASVILGKAATDLELARSRDILVASMREGVTLGYQRGIDSDGALRKLLTTDASFRSRYESDPAFRDGIQSVIWQATFHRDEYDTAAVLNTGYRGPTRM